MPQANELAAKQSATVKKTPANRRGGRGGHGGGGAADPDAGTDYLDHSRNSDGEYDSTDGDYDMMELDT